MRKKYVTRVLTAAVILGLLAGCGSQKADGTGDSAVAAQDAGGQLSGSAASGQAAGKDAAGQSAESGSVAAEASGNAAESDSQRQPDAADSRIAAASEMADAEAVVEEWMVPVTADSLVDGTYPVTVASSSSMFKVDSASLNVRDGEMEAVLVMGGTGYLHVFMGTPEEAVTAEEAEYIPYEENADGVHTFTIPVKALDAGIDCAAFSKRKEKWYARTIVVRSDSLPASAWSKEALTTAADLGLSDGTYTIGVSLSGGSGRASVESPARLRIKGDSAVATIIWNSSKYDYMIVDGEKYEPVRVENGAEFEIPVSCFDRPIRVIGDTTAMSKPHEIEYVLVFNSETIK